jgi:hypothetical protein
MGTRLACDVSFGPMQPSPPQRIVSHEQRSDEECDEQGHADRAGGSAVVRDADGDDRRLTYRPLRPQAKTERPSGAIRAAFLVWGGRGEGKGKEGVERRRRPSPKPLPRAGGAKSWELSTLHGRHPGLVPWSTGRLANALRLRTSHAAWWTPARGWGDGCKRASGPCDFGADACRLDSGANLSPPG